MGDTAGGFLAVFEQRVAQLRKRLRDELEKDKPVRSGFVYRVYDYNTH